MAPAHLATAPPNATSGPTSDVGTAVIPLSDGIRAKRFPFVNVAIIVANLLVWILYEVPNLGSSVTHSSFYPCAVDGACHHALPWVVSWLSSPARC